MKYLLFALTMLAISHLACAQAPTPADAFAYFETNGTQKDGFFKVTLPSTTGITAIRVRLGTSSDNYDLVDYTFLFDITSGLPLGFGYQRTNNECRLGIGLIEEPAMTFGEVILQDSNGNWGVPFNFINN